MRKINDRKILIFNLLTYIMCLGLFLFIVFFSDHLREFRVFSIWVIIAITLFILAVIQSYRLWKVKKKQSELDK
ncbi:hypothetical protein [Bacillus suaedae]|uniref:Uncharacterized protein n=1 Tax=Halalkalibacter suaedae TaxID=2822140 RepID=A0A941APV2_9BACI|nr:hypothetical protein [Bacillus suaedae]MBP3950503.1 hypothetical protein [Bacillus suaedae]